MATEDKEFAFPLASEVWLPDVTPIDWHAHRLAIRHLILERRKCNESLEPGQRCNFIEYPLPDIPAKAVDHIFQVNRIRDQLERAGYAIRFASKDDGRGDSYWDTTRWVISWEKAGPDRLEGKTGL